MDYINMLNPFAPARQEAEDAEEFRDMDLEELKRKATGAKSQRTLAKKALNGALDAFNAAPSAIEAQNVSEKYHRMQQWDSRLRNVYSAIMEQVAGEDDGETELKNAEEGTARIDAEAAPFRKKVADALRGMPATPAQVGLEAAGGNGQRPNQPEIRYKPEASLKPKELTEDATPEEMYQWSIKIRGYFYTCGINTLPAYGQATHIRSCIDEKLLHRIRDKVTDQLPVFAAPERPNENNWMKVIEREFEEIHPIFDRRYKIARMKQDKGETFMAFIKRARDARTQAHMDQGISGDEFLALIMLMGVNDEDLRKKFLEQENPSITDLERLGRAHDRTVKGVERKDANHAGTVQKIGPKGFGNGANGGQAHNHNGSNGSNGRGNGNKLAPIVQEALKARPDLQGKCLTCGASGHSKNECTRKNVVCAKCGNKHDESVCLRQQIDSIKAKRTKAGTVQQVQQQQQQTPQQGKPFTEEAPAGQGPLANLTGRINMIRARPIGKEEQGAESARARSPSPVKGEPSKPGQDEAPITVRDEGIVKALLRAAKGVSQDTPAMPL